MPHAHLASAFGDDWFALKAEAFARFFGTPFFLTRPKPLSSRSGSCSTSRTSGSSTNTPSDILLNLAFSLQAAYAALNGSVTAQHRARLDRMSNAPPMCV